MEAVIFCGIQATGKTSFYKQHFFETHMRISMDQLHTRNKEGRFLEVCLSLQQPFVIDNTNPSRADREKYISLAKQHKFAANVAGKKEAALLQYGIADARRVR